MMEPMMYSVMKNLLPAAAALFAVSCCGPMIASDGEIAVVPRPERVEAGEGRFVWTPATPLVVEMKDSTAAWVVDAWNETAVSVFGRPADIAGEDREHAVLIAEDATLAPEAYRLTVTPTHVDIEAGAPAGAFRAVQTWRQLLAPEAFGAGNASGAEVPCAVICDAPCLGYRGVMLDVARHFFTVDEVKRTLDIMALHKMNIFHWHLTDDQGWRIEIRKYPELTRTGSVRRRTLVGHDPGGEYDETCRYDETPHGGFYTREEIRDVVDYAARRFITVIPEIEFPGHSVAALASYPWLGCTGEQYEVRQTWDIDDRVCCIGRETTFGFVEDVLSEVAELFPGQYVHIGGDECPTVMWESCPACRERMRAEGMTRPRQLQNYATARIERFLRARGKRLIGWDEILDGELSATAVVMSWRGTEGGIRAAQHGNDVIMAPSSHCYFDYAQSQRPDEPLSWGGDLPVAKVHAFEPFEGLAPEQRPHILGVQANLWTEYIADFPHVQYMLLPRLAALSEVGWALDRREYPDFLRRLRRMARLYDACGYRYAQHVFEE